MHRNTVRSAAGALGRVPPATLVALVTLFAGIAVVELGWRDPSPGLAVAVHAPEPIAAPVAELRSIPQRHVEDARAGAVAAGVVFGRADDVPVADQQAFLDSGLWHLLRYVSIGQNVEVARSVCRGRPDG